MATSFHHPFFTDYVTKLASKITSSSKFESNNKYQRRSGDRTNCRRRLVVTNAADALVLSEPSDKRAYPQQTPHSGRHFSMRPNRRRRRLRRHRFTEGWYYRLTLPTYNVSFAFIVSIEDPGQMYSSPLHLVCIQCIGPNDEYIVQGKRNDTLFWAWKHQQGLGYIFDFKNNTVHRTSVNHQSNSNIASALQKQHWKDVVESGFQILPNHLIGRVRGKDGTVGDIISPPYTNDQIRTCDFDFSIDPICGWGGTTIIEQKSTAGWLSYYPIFEPHWQITLADARASGSVTWNNISYVFTNAPFYAEKNWGAALPRKWYWTQCNSFVGYNQLSVVAGGGIRKIPLGNEEALGMVSCHYNGTLYEAVPWLGGMSWNVSTWGSWTLRGNSTLCDHPFEIEVTYHCNPKSLPGLVFRAPTPDEGLVRFCRDTFEADCTLTLWLLEWDDVLEKFVRKNGRPLIDQATSTMGGAEVGGGPWWDDWIGEARLKKPVQALLRLPYRIGSLKQRMQKWIRRSYT